jgi:hypothetical protein
VLTPDDVRTTLARVAYTDAAGEPWDFHVGDDGGTLWLQIRFEAACTSTGVRSRQHGRKWRLSPHMTRSEVVHTAFKAVLTDLRPARSGEWVRTAA